ncbi:hypothetical protein JNUCC64_10225 [Streptomyces sp. JNUCC 64]
MTPGRARRTFRALAVTVALGALVLTGCGIRPTDVIEAGGPATVTPVPGPSNRLLLFFHTPDGEAAPVIRKAVRGWNAEGSPPTSYEALRVLLEGPTEEERAAGLRTSLPKLSGSAGTVRSKPSSQRGTIDAFLPLRLADLADTAVRQLICTVAYAEDRDGAVQVALRGTDAAMEAASCGADVNREEVPRPRTSELSGTEDEPLPPPDPAEGRFPTVPPSSRTPPPDDGDPDGGATRNGTGSG